MTRHSTPVPFATSSLPHRSAPAAPSHGASEPASTFQPEAYTQPFCKFMTDNPTVWHAVAAVAAKLEAHGYTRLSERDAWAATLKAGGKYFFERNGSGLVAFAIGGGWRAGQGVAVIGAHIDALTARLKPTSTKPTVNGFEQLGVAQYGGALSALWLDRDLGVGGRVFVRDPKSGKTEMRLAKLAWPIARIPSIAPHFGIAPEGQPNRETRMVPVIGVDNTDLPGFAKKEGAAGGEASSSSPVPGGTLLGVAGTFAQTQPAKLLKAIAGEVGAQDASHIVNWELELFDTQPAQVGGLAKDLIFAGRIDDKLCSWAAIEALLRTDTEDSGLVKMVGLFDDEEVGSLLRQGAKSNFLTSAVERVVAAFSKEGEFVANLYRTYANGFLVSADVDHAFNPNYREYYMENHSPRLNIGVTVSYDPNANMTTNAASVAVLDRVAQRCGSALQGFQIRNDSSSGGTIGPSLSAMTGLRAIDAGIPQLSMHSIRATTGALDPGLGVKIFKGFFDHFEEVDKEFA